MPSVYRPFPLSVRADSNGAFFEEILPDGSSVYVIVMPVRYEINERDQRWLDDGVVTLDELYPSISIPRRTPGEGCLWLYRVQIFTVARQYHEDQVMFSDHAENFSYKVFDDYCELMDFCLKNYGIMPEDFKKSWKTS